MSSPPAPLPNNALSHDDVDSVCLASKTSTMLAVKSYMLWEILEDKILKILSLSQLSVTVRVQVLVGSFDPNSGFSHLSPKKVLSRLLFRWKWIKSESLVSVHHGQ